jgi:hypothetical protein
VGRHVASAAALGRGPALEWDGSARRLGPRRPDTPSVTLTTNTPWDRQFHQHPHHTPHHGAKEARHRTGASLQGDSGVMAWVDEPRFSLLIGSQREVDDELCPRLMLMDAEARTRLSDECTNDFDPDAAVAFTIEARWQTGTFITD